MTTVNEILDMARSLLGIEETPPGSNIVHPILDWYGEQGIQWCAATVAYVFHHVDPELIHGLKSAYSGDYLEVGREHGEEVYDPQPGAIAIMDYGDGGITDHIGIVESVYGDHMNLIEGNHNNRVERVDRVTNGSTQFWYIMPRYSQATEEDDMNRSDSGVSRTAWAAAFNSINGNDVWVKVWNPDPALTVPKVHIGAVCEGGHGAEEFSLSPGEKHAISAKQNCGFAGEAFISVTADPPGVVVTMEQAK